MKRLRGVSRSIAVALTIVVVSFLLVSCTYDKQRKDEIDYFRSEVRSLENYFISNIEDELSVIRWYLDDSGDYDEITRADAQEAYEGLESFLEDLDATLRDFVSVHENDSW